MELTREDTQKAKGVAILGMVMLHLFCRLDELPYTPWIWIRETPLVYYLGLFGDVCVPIYCFCSGYAHYLLGEKHGTQYGNVILKKLLRFLSHYWIVVALFCMIGLITGHGDTIPGSVFTFLGNILLYRISYNGAWWFVVTYVFLCALSPISIKLTKRLPPAILIGVSGVTYLASYLFRFRFPLSIPNAVLDWAWQQFVLLGTSQFGYMIGMVCRKNRCLAGLRKYLYEKPAARHISVRIIIIVLPFAAFLGHCMVQSAIVAPITAASVLLWLYLCSHPAWVNWILLFLGRHSTNIWLTHMFFYLTLFSNLVFVAKYPLLIFVFMMMLCLCSSWLIDGIEKLLWKYTRRNG